MSANRWTSIGLMIAGALAVPLPAWGQASETPLYRMVPAAIRQIVLDQGRLDTGVTAHSLALQLWPLYGKSPAAYQHRIPARTENAAAVSLRVRPFSTTDMMLARTHPFEHPFKRVLTYWGCGDPGREPQPRALRAENLSDDILSERLAPSPAVRDALRRVARMSEDQQLSAKEDIRFPEELQMVGAHELRGGGVSLRFEVDERGEFLPPPEVTRVWIADDGAIHLFWNTSPAASAYFVNMFVQKKMDPDVVIWTSSRAAEGGWVLSQNHPGGEPLKRLLHTGVLLGPQTGSCIIPARATRHAGEALVIQVHAYAPEVELPSRVEPHAGAVSVKVAPRGTTSVLVIDPRNQSRTRAHAASSSDPLRARAEH